MKTRMRDQVCVLVVLALFGLNASCSSSAKENLVVKFQFVSLNHDELFVASATDAVLIASVREELSKPIADRSRHINGTIARGTGNNAPWEWHFVVDEWRLAELSMELCDSWPSYVEENLDKWLEEVGALCPWSSRVVKEL